MKVILLLFLVIGVILAVVYWGGGYKSFDPTEQGKAAKAAITPGMTWKQVLDVAGEPARYKHTNLQKQKIGGETVETLKPGTPVAFSRAKLEKRIANGETPHGFTFLYNFSSSVAFEVEFDSTLTVVGVQDVITMADLLDSK